MNTERDSLTRLIEAAEPARKNDAKTAALGLKTRVLAAIREESPAESPFLGPVGLWADAFLRAAVASVALVAALGIWTFFSADWSAAGVGGDSAFSALIQPTDWPATQPWR